MSNKVTKRRPSVPKSRPYVLTSAQLRRLLEFCAKDESLRDLHDVAAIIFYTGLRIGELARLRWQEVDFDRRHIVVVPHKSARNRCVP